MSYMGDLQIALFEKLGDLFHKGRMPQAGQMIRVQARTYQGERVLCHRLTWFDMESFKSFMNCDDKMIGRRVSAMISPDRLLGHGVYEADSVPPPEANKALSSRSVMSPRIKLDNGDVIWGCECWWMAEGKLPLAEGYAVVSIEDVRSGKIER